MLNIVYLVYILIYINPNLKKIITKMTTPTVYISTYINPS